MPEELPKDREGLARLRRAVVLRIHDITRGLDTDNVSADERLRMSKERRELEWRLGAVNKALAGWRPVIDRIDVITPRERAAVDIAIALIQSDVIERFIAPLSDPDDVIEEITEVAWEMVDSIAPRKVDET